MNDNFDERAKSLLPSYILSAALVLAALTTLKPYANAQGGVPLWTNRWPVGPSEGVSAVAVDGSGDVFVTGDSGGYFVTVKYSSTGALLWSSRYNGPGDLGDSPVAIAADPNGDVLVAGTSYGDSDTGYAVVKYSSVGVPLWARRYIGSVGSDNHLASMALDRSGNVFVTGETFDPQSGYDYESATLAYSSAGVPLWTNRYHGPNNGGAEFSAIAVDGSGDVFVAGISWDGSTVCCARLIVIKYSGVGTPLWTNLFIPATAYAIAADSSGNVFVTGESLVTVSNSDYVTVAYSGAGAPLWTNRYSGPGIERDIPRAIAVGSNGNVFVTGYSFVTTNDSDYATVAYSNGGVPLWTNRYNGPGNSWDYAVATATDTNGNVFITGGSENSGGLGFDYATLAYSSAGVPLWTHRYHAPGSGDSYARAIAVDNAGNLFVAGSDGGDFGTIKYSQTLPPAVDSDADSVPDAQDQCPYTLPGEIVNADGCSISQLVPCDSPWKNHGEYISFVAHVANEFLKAGLITAEQKEAIISAASQSNCGKKQ